MAEFNGGFSNNVNQGGVGVDAALVEGKPNKKVSQPTIPVFVSKLLAMVNEPSNRDLIFWSPDGDTFKVTDVDKLAAVELPKYFKHNNFTSLVRQLNMYGFHKVAANPATKLMTHSTPKDIKEVVEFHHSFVHRDHPELLTRIKRKENKKPPKIMDKSDISRMHQELTVLKEENHKLKGSFNAVQQENDALWKEAAEHRKRHAQQQWTIDNIMKYLSVLYQNGSIERPTESFLAAAVTGTTTTANDNTNAVQNMNSNSANSNNNIDNNRINDRSPKRQKVARNKSGPKPRTLSAPPVITPSSLGLHPQPSFLDTPSHIVHENIKRHHDSVDDRLSMHRDSLTDHMPNHWLDATFNPPDSVSLLKPKDDSVTRTTKDATNDFMQNLELGNFNLAPLDDFLGVDNSTTDTDSPNTTNANQDHTVPNS